MHRPRMLIKCVDVINECSLILICHFDHGKKFAGKNSRSETLAENTRRTERKILAGWNEEHSGMGVPGNKKRDKKHGYSFRFIG